VRHAKDVVPITEHISGMRTNGVQTDKGAVFWRDQMKQLRACGQIVRDVIVESDGEL